MHTSSSSSSSTCSYLVAPRGKMWSWSLTLSWYRGPHVWIYGIALRTFFKKKKEKRKKKKERRHWGWLAFIVYAYSFDIMNFKDRIGRNLHYCVLFCLRARKLSFEESFLLRKEVLTRWEIIGNLYLDLCINLFLLLLLLLLWVFFWSVRIK
jgi:hypothetical protein